MAESLATRLRVTLPTPLGRPRSAFFWIGASVLASFFLVALLAPLIAPYSPDAYAARPIQSPSREHWLGTNEVGQDVLSQLVHGTRVSLTVAIIVGGAGVLVALFVGILSGAVGGRLDTALMRLVDVVVAVPHLPLLIVVAVFLGPGLLNVVTLITLLTWARPARVIRAQVLSLRERGYVRSTRLYGASWLYIMRRHLLPAVAPIGVAAAVTLAGRAVLMEATLAFLGIGDPTLHSWGMMMHQALSYRGIFLTQAWLWWILPPGICLSLMVLALTMLGTSAESYSNARLARHQAR